MKRTTFFLLFSFASQAVATDNAVDLHDCVDSPQYCNLSPVVVFEDGCDQFHRFRGRISWPPLQYVAPVSISVKTRADYFTSIPLYVEVRKVPPDRIECSTTQSARLVLSALGGASCGGTWETIGPLDLSPYGIHEGDSYVVRLVFFESVPNDFGQTYHSPWFSCIDVVPSTSAVTNAGWGHVKALYR